MNEIYERHKKNIEFLCIYIREAHPEDGISGVRIQSNADDGILTETHSNIEERAAAAEMCVLRLNLMMPMAIDDMTDQVDQAYRAMPDKLLVVDAQGKITYCSEQGPMGFFPNQWEIGIKSTINRYDQLERIPTPA